MTDRATEIALFRYALIREAADPALSHAERGRAVRALAELSHPGPDGVALQVSRNSVDRWIRTWRAGGFEALKPGARSTNPRTPEAILDLACSLRRENPGRTGAQIARIIAETQGWSPSARTLQRHFAKVGLDRRHLTTSAVAFGRFEASKVNELWVGDGLVGPVIAGRRAVLVAFLDDHSRAFMGYRWSTSEDAVRAAAALRAGIGARGLPSAIYLDNGSGFVSGSLLRACAVLGVRLIHSRPGKPQGRGKIERVFRTVREQFLVEVDPEVVADLVRLNQLFAAWVETVYHHAVHSETGVTPLQRLAAAPVPVVPGPELLREAFLWSETRTVTKTATVSMHANVYEVDAALIGRKVELVFNPFDLAVIEVRWNNRPMGVALPVTIGRHAHPAARPEVPAPPAAGSGIDYLALVEARRDRSDEARISYSGIGSAPAEVSPGRPPLDPNQLVLPRSWERISAGNDHDRASNDDNSDRDHDHDNEEGIR
ncbi:MAG: DDE-type integrase/transposase/recombinase [Acidimicrobiales bacterium]